MKHVNTAEDPVCRGDAFPQDSHVYQLANCVESQGFRDRPDGVEICSFCYDYTHEDGSIQTPLPKRPKTEATTSICALCLGVSAHLRSLTSQDFISISDGWRMSKDIGIGIDISLPACIAMRQHAFYVSLGVATPGRILLKGAMKGALKDWIATSKRGLLYNQGSELKLMVTLSGDLKELEADWVLSSGNNRGKKSAKKRPIVLASEKILNKIMDMNHSEFRDRCPQSARDLHSPQQPCRMHLKLCRNAVHIGGRYRKLIRTMPQSPWTVDGKTVGHSSVTEELKKMIIGSNLGIAEDEEDLTFVSAGREDIDVRMLGSGRPFALVIQNSKLWPPTDEECMLMEKTINESKCGVEVGNLRVLSSDEMKVLKQGESEKDKVYSAVCWLPRSVTDDDLEKLNGITEPITIHQRTPVRVLHRRANLERSRLVSEIRAERLTGQDRYFSLKMQTQAGAYVKEFVHGDFGRTKPNVRELLRCHEVEIVALDVTEIDMNF